MSLRSLQYVLDTVRVVLAVPFLWIGVSLLPRDAALKISEAWRESLRRENR